MGNLEIRHLIVPEEYNEAILVPIGDIHIGSPQCDDTLLKRVLKWGYDTKNVFMFGMGDFGEFAIDPKIGLHEQIYDSDEQLDVLFDLFKPMADVRRLVGLLRGNHEKRFMKMRYDPMRQLGRSLNVPYYGAAQTILFKVGHPNGPFFDYTAHLIHGKSGSRKLITKLNSCIQLREVVRNADMYIMGHTHALAHTPIVSYEIDVFHQTKTYNPVHFILTGSFLEYEGGYGEEGGLAPTGKLGAPKIKLHTKEKRITVSL